MKVVISNGFNRFHLAPLAAELQHHGKLLGLFTAGWPKGWQQYVAEAFPRNAACQRFLDRKESVDDALVHSFVVSELLWGASRGFGGYHGNARELVEEWALKAYIWRARTALCRLKPEIYHYRSCFGLKSAHAAKANGIITLCDQSIAHPRILAYMVRNNGKFPPGAGNEPETLVDKYMEADLNQAAYVLVNSDFVKQTCVRAGMCPERIHVLYWGVDDKFLDGVVGLDRPQVCARSKDFLFAGGLQTRKGAWQLMEVFGSNSKQRLAIAGGVEGALRDHTQVKDFLAAANVEFLGYLSRSELAWQMTQHRVFVFPSLCEGSARVVFEAMACGCYVITTPNAGSIVQDGVHGKLVPAGDTLALAAAVDWAIANRRSVAEIGWRNAQLIRREYRQCNYGENVMALYHRLLHQQ